MALELDITLFTDDKWRQRYVLYAAVLPMGGMLLAITGSLLHLDDLRVHGWMVALFGFIIQVTYGQWLKHEYKQLLEESEKLLAEHRQRHEEFRTTHIQIMNRIMDKT